MYHVGFLLPFLITSFAVALPTDNGPTDSSRILMISGIFRHGERSPLETYPTDPYKNYKWHGGLGALSKKGALQHYVLGGKLRSRYNELLPEDGQYTKENVLVQSSNTERCILSAQSMLAGFMPPRKTENRLSVSWHPIPVMTTPKSLDEIIAQERPCEKYKNIYQDQLINLPEDIKQLNEESEQLYQYLSKHTGKRY